MNCSVPVVHGIPNCGSVKKARDWLTQRGLPHEFHDFKKRGVSHIVLEAWAQRLGWDRLINRQGLTWRKMSSLEQALMAYPTPEAFEYLQAHASLIKRPVIHWPSGDITVGMDESLFSRLCS